ncbi:MAG TPA: VCBS repeat-containing protein [Minicystis sp.]|nr:VCBS repeat-containing protein [Minicystis sp.]
MRSSMALLALVSGSLLAALSVTSCGGGGGGSGGGDRDGGTVYKNGDVEETAACKKGAGTKPVQKPVFKWNAPTDTGWFSSPGIVDLSDGKTTTRALVVPTYSIDTFDATGKTISHVDSIADRIYAPAPVGDFDGDGVTDLAVGSSSGKVAAYAWTSAGWKLKPGWDSASTDSGGDSPETRGMAAADLDGDGKVELVFTTTNTSDTGAQVFVFEPDGKIYQPASAKGFTAWPRYNTASGPGNDADFNGQGNQGYGCYGLNVAIGQLDDTPELEIVTTYDNHQINVFHNDGTSLLASDYFTNPQNDYLNKRMGWGQFIRWADPKIEEDHYHKHTGDWPDPGNGQMWLQWTASPPTVVDLDGDGKNEVIGFPNGETGDPYVTQTYLFAAFDGNYGDGSRAAMRHAGFEQFPKSQKPPVRDSGDYYPPDGVPSPAVANLLGDAAPEVVVSLNDGFVYAYDHTSKLLWKYDATHGKDHHFMSEPVIADLNDDGRPEVIFGTYSLDPGGGHLIILANTGELLFDVPLPNQGMNGNGIGIPAAPTVGDLDGDGQLEIAVVTFDHGVDVFTVPGSKTACMPWPTGRGNYLRNGQGPNYAP